MKILMLTNHLEIGGISSYLTTIGEGLKNRGHEVIVASRGGAMVERFEVFGIRHIELPLNTKNEFGIKVFKSYFKLANFLRKEKVDVIHAQTRVTQVLAKLCSARFSIPYVVTVHGFFKNRLSRRLMGLWGDHSIAISDQVFDHLKNDFSVPEKDVTIVNNGIDYEFFSQRPSDSEIRKFKSEHGITEGPIIGIISRLSEVKGHQYLIDAMYRVLKKMPEARLLIIGDGKEDYRKRLVSRTEKLGISGKVIFIPSTLKLRTALGAIDIFVLPSIQEGLGLSLLEAMASGTPVVASEAGGIKSVIKDMHNGLLVRPKSEEAIYAAIMELIENKSLANKLITMSQETVKQRFNREYMIRKTEEVYRSVIGEQAG